MAVTTFEKGNARCRQRSARVACLAGVILLSGCTTSGPKPLPKSARKYTQPTVAVLAFENKAVFPLNWNIGSGVREILVNELVKCGRYSVVTRADLDAIVGELEIQKSPLFRTQGRAMEGQLKNVQYLIRGAVTNFTHTAGLSLRALLPKWAGGTSGMHAIISLTLYVISVETGEILASESLDGHAYAASLDLSGVYKGVTLGGDAFYRTPLGKATKQVMKQALERIAQHIALEQWRPTIAKVTAESGEVLLSGGVDRAVKEGSLWGVYTRGQKILDPSTGDALGNEPPRKTGRIQVLRVHPKFSEGRILEGTAEVGQFLQLEEVQPAKAAR